MSEMVERACRVICKSGKFECGQGCCAPICMEALGEARKSCSHVELVHGVLARAVIAAMREPTASMINAGIAEINALTPGTTPEACWRGMIDEILK